MAYGKYRQAWKAPERATAKRGGKSYTVKRHLPRYLRTLLIVLPLLIIVYAVLFSSLLSVRTIVVTGNQAIAASDMESVARTFMQERRVYIFPQSSVLFIDTAELQRRLQSQFPGLASVEISREIPFALSIHVSEFNSVALWQAGGQYFQIASDGHVLGSASNPQPGAIVMTDSTRVNPIQAGDVPVQPDTLALLQKINEALLSTPTLTPTQYDLSEVSLFTIHAMTTAGVDVLFSTHLDLPTQINKLKIFAASRAQKNKDWTKGLKYIDLRFSSTRIYYQ